MAEKPGNDAPHYSAEDARQGEIILRKPWQRIVFIAGRVGMVVLAILFLFAPT